jgi:DNA-binding MarR family transcriptional regulator
MSMKTSQPEQDSIGRWLETQKHALPGIDLTVEGIVDRIQALGKYLMRSQEETLRELGVGWAEWQVVRALRLAGEPYRLSPGQLAERSKLSSGAMTNRLDRLEEAGLVNRLPDPEDRRALQIELTDDGRRLWERFLAAQGAKESRVAAALDPREQTQLNDLLRRLVLGFERDDV